MTRDKKHKLFVELLQKATNCDSPDLYVLYDHLDWDNLVLYRRYRIDQSSLAIIRSICHKDCKEEFLDYDKAIEILQNIIKRQSIRSNVLDQIQKKWSMSWFGK